jgi:tryptophanase
VNVRSYKSTMVDPVRLLPREDREAALADAGYNVFNLDSADVFVDLLTDSGTGTMSNDQWAAMVRGDEAYAGSEGFAELEAAAREVMGFEQIVPAHQGRGAENVLYGALVSEGDTVLNNAHFDTTRAHVAANGGDPVDCPVEAATDMESEAPFKGDFSVARGRQVVEEVGDAGFGVGVVPVTPRRVVEALLDVDEDEDAASNRR